MGLAEKRVLEEFKKTFTNTLLPQLKSSTPFELEYEVVWDDIYKVMESDSLNMQDTSDYFVHVFVTPTIAAFKSICADEMGTNALKGFLKKVKFCNTASNCVTQAYKMENGVLTVDHCRANIDDYYTKERGDFLTKTLEKAL